jgi:hypothetical protein
MLGLIPTRIHGIIDYLTGIAMIAAPYLLGFADGTAAQWVPIVIGVLIIGQSLMTDYEVSMARVIPMPAHLMMDVGTGLVLAASPWLFGFADRVYLPHLAVGLFELAVVVLSQRHATTSRHGLTSVR